MTLCDGKPKYTTEPREKKLNLPDGIPALNAFYLYLTSACNLCCRHCWVAPAYTDGELSPSDYLDLALLKRSVAEAKLLGLAFAKLTGGEPTLHPQFLEIVDLLTAEGLSMDLETNGTLIDKTLAQHLKERTNVTFISVSIDGPTPEIHDPFRGISGSFDAAVRGFKYLVGAGYRPQLITCLHKNNVVYVEEMVRLAGELGAGSVKFNPVTDAGRAAVIHENGGALDFEEILRLAHFIQGPLQERARVRLFLSTPLALQTIGELIRAGDTAACQIRHTLGILGSGEMALCGIGHTIPQLCFGNLRDSSVTDVWLSHPMLQQLRQGLDSEYPGVCGQCIHAGRCLTYCVAQNYQNTGQLIAPARLCTEAYERGLFPASRLRANREQ